MLPTPLRVGSWYGMLRVMAWFATNPPQGGVMVWYAEGHGMVCYQPPSGWGHGMVCYQPPWWGRFI
jgi:hypothetical protein